MRHTECDIGESFLEKERARLFLKLYRYNVDIDVGQQTANAYHDFFSRFCDRFVQLAAPSYHRVIDRLVSSYIEDGWTVLDLCCGTGNIALAVARKAGQVVGVDTSPAMLEKARCKASDRGVDNARFVHGDVTRRLDFADGTFDAVTAGFSIPTNVPLFRGSNQDAMSEACRVLREGGRLVLLEGLHEVSRMYLSREEYERVLEGAGFTDLEMTSVSGIYGVVCATK